MNTVSFPSGKPVVLAKNVSSGVLFTYPGGDKLYLKTAIGYNHYAIKLDDGLSYGIEGDKHICPLPKGTAVTLSANAACGLC